MKKELQEQDAQLRQYLLGELTPDNQQSIEERLLTDNDFMEQLLIVEDDLIDDYSAEKLSSQQKASYQKLFLASPEGKQKLKASTVLKKHLNDFHLENNLPTFWERVQLALTQALSPTVLKAAAALLVMSLGVFSWWAFFQSDVRRGLDALSKAYGEQRPVEARITGLPYASYIGPAKFPSQSSATKLKVAEKAFHDLMDDKRTASSLHALGKFSLTQKEFDEAIGYLEEATKLNPHNASIQTDLAVAFLERGKRAKANSLPETAKADFENCQKYLSLALAKDQNSPDALFNLALLHQTTQSWKQAEETWQLFLQIETNTKWIEEAQRYRKIAIESQQD